MLNKEENDQKQPFNLGYLFHYPQIGRDEPFQLDICITDTPTEKHYDPEWVECSVVSHGKERVEHLRIEHPWNSFEKYRVCAGVIRLVDRVGKVEEALTFGGNLSIDSKSENTCLYFSSPAPILKITNTTQLNELLRDEIEILFAERRAHWLSKEDEFDKRLIQADPLKLYRAFLKVLIKKFESTSYREPLDAEALHFFHTEIERLNKAGLRANRDSDLAELL